MWVGAASAQEAGGDDRLRVFFDCQTFGCDFDLTRREIPWVDWVRIREDADVHLLVSMTEAGAGFAYEIAFIGRGELEGRDRTLRFTSSSTDTDDERRRGLIRRFRLGLVPYLTDRAVAERLDVTYEAPGDGVGPAAAAPDPADDPWDLWVFTARLGGRLSGQSRTNSQNVNGFFTASRTSEDWKINIGTNASYTEDEFEFESGDKLKSVSRSLGADLLVVRSVGPRWGVGGRASLTSSTFSNFDSRLSVQPAVEFNVFPYSESSRRSLTFQYRVGLTQVVYDEETIFFKTEETLYEQSLTASLGLRQPWGGASLSLTGSHFLDDIDKNRVTVFGNLNLRVSRGLSIGFFGTASRVRDQINLPRRGASDDEVLLRRRLLETDFTYSLSVNLSYTFG
ncbi:MAG: DUF481 domain-containing protein, partial [Gemmatimonadetes bacterium]